MIACNPVRMVVELNQSILTALPSIEEEVVVSTKNSEIGQIWNARFFNGITNWTRMVVLCKDSSALCRALYQYSY